MGESRRSLSDLFGDPERRPADGRDEDAEFGGGVAELFQRIDEDRARALEAAEAAEAAQADPASDHVPHHASDRAPDPGPDVRRRPGRCTVLAAAGVVGLGLAVAGVIAVTGQQVPDAGDAKVLDALAAAEETLAERERMLEGARERLTEAQAAGVADAGRAEAMLASLAGFSDEAARTTALAAVATYREGLQGLVLSDVPAADDRNEGEPGAEALDAIGARLEIADDLLAEAAAAESELLTLGAALTAAQSGFLATIPAFADALAVENPRADEQFRAAVTAAAASVASPGGGDPAVQAYIAAIAALRADEARAVEEARQRQERVPDPGPQPDPEPQPEPPPAPTPPPPVPTTEPTEPPPPPPEPTPEDPTP